MPIDPTNPIAGAQSGVEVIQEDKDRSVDLAHALGLSAEEFTSGAADIIVQHLARHRLATEARIVAWLGNDHIGYAFANLIKKGAHHG